MDLMSQCYFMNFFCSAYIILWGGGRLISLSYFRESFAIRALLQEMIKVKLEKILTLFNLRPHIAEWGGRCPQIISFRLEMSIGLKIH